MHNVSTAMHKLRSDFCILDVQLRIARQGQAFWRLASWTFSSVLSARVM